MKAEWAALKSKALTQSAAESDAAHAALTDHLQQLMELVGARSKTSLDPEVTTHALIHLASDYTPKALIYAGNMRRYAVKAAAKGYLGGDDRMGIQIYRDRFHAEIDEPELRSSSCRPTRRPSCALPSMPRWRPPTELRLGRTGEAHGRRQHDSHRGGDLRRRRATNRAVKKLSVASYEATVKALAAASDAT